VKMRAVLLVGLLSAVTGLSTGGESPSADAAAQPVAARLVGSWRLVSIATVRPNGQEVTDWAGPKPSGLLMYQPNGYMSAQIRLDPPASWSHKSVDDATVEERANAFDRYYGYFGRYDVDESKGVVHHYVESSLEPPEVGVTYERHLRIEGDTLFLTTEPFAFKGEQRYNKLVWERVK
jgi:hypothetical protein